jgi:tetratricopeptide (TPR) repeat protein
MTGDLEQRYLEGVARWRERDLAAAVEILELVLALPGTADEIGWWFSTSRALAQIALELDDPDSAEWYLRRLQGTGVGDAQTLALRARRHMQMGEEEEAMTQVDTAAIRLAEDHSEDVGSLMNGAIALGWSAEVLAELGLGDDASGLMTRARGRIARAGIDDSAVNAMLRMVEASVARLVGMGDTAAEFLNRLDVSSSPDLAIQADRERARLAIDSGDNDGAKALYVRCLGLAEEAGYVFLERSLREELAEGPPRMRTVSPPIGQWSAQAREGLPQEPLPYAVVITLPAGSKAVQELEAAIAEVVREQPALGIIDGSGSDGTIWEIFLEGEDPDALWEAVKPHLVPFRSEGVEVQLRRDDRTVRFNLEDS